MGAATTNRGRPLQGAALGNTAVTAEQLLERAALVVRERRRTYGQPRELFEQIARRWSLVLGRDVTTTQAVLCMLEVKSARLTRDPRHLDSITDIAGYAAILASCSMMHDLRSHLGRHQPTRIDPEAAKRVGWREHGILVVAEHDPRLSWPEREMVRQLGLKLYGHRPGDRR